MLGMEKQIKGRLTLEKFKEFVNSEFKRVELDGYECTRVERTNYSQDQYEGGACRLVVFFKHKENDYEGHFPCFYPLKYYQKSINNGDKMVLQFQYRSTKTWMQDLEVELKKI
jgi:hypothetical protein